MTAQELQDRLARVSILNHKYLTNADGTPQRFRINGKVKTWRRDQFRIYIPLKRGMYQYEHIDSVVEFFEHFNLER